MSRARASTVLAAALWLCLEGSGPRLAFAEEPAARAVRTLPQGFVYLHDVDPTIEQDMRYARAENFTGAVVDGYEAGECILTRPTAVALSRAQKRLAQRHPGHSLKVLDCYRPVRAVRRFAAWSREAGAVDATSYYHPSIPRRRLFALGYIAEQSGHSRGNVVDITIVKSDGAAPSGSAAEKAGESSASIEAAGADGGRVVPAAGLRGAACTGPAPAEGASRELDMGTDFDCFDVRSNTHNAGIGAQAKRARTMLLDVMESAGFENFPKEWWHFSFARGAATTAGNFVVAPRSVTLPARTDAPR